MTFPKCQRALLFVVFEGGRKKWGGGNIMFSRTRLREVAVKGHAELAPHPVDGALGSNERVDSTK